MTSVWQLFASIFYFRYDEWRRYSFFEFTILALGIYIHEVITRRNLSFWLLSESFLSLMPHTSSNYHLGYVPDGIICDFLHLSIRMLATLEKSLCCQRRVLCAAYQDDPPTSGYDTTLFAFLIECVMHVGVNLMLQCTIWLVYSPVMQAPVVSLRYIHVFTLFI